MQIDLNKPVTPRDIGPALRSFAAWWSGELSSLLPEEMRAWLRQPFEHWTLLVLEGRWRLVSPNPAVPELQLDVTEPAGSLKAFITNRVHRIGQVDVRLPRTDFVIRRIRLPAATQSHLRSVIKLQLERLSPFHAQDVEFDYRVLDLSAERELDVEVALIPKTKLQDYEARLDAMGLAARKYFVDVSTLGFRPHRSRLRIKDRLQFSLGALAVVFWCLALALTPNLRQAELDRLSRQAGQLRLPAEEINRLRDYVASVETPLTAAGHELQYPASLDILETLTTLFPDNTFVHELTIAGNDVRANVETENLSAFTALLHRSKRFRVSYMSSGQILPNSHTRLDIELDFGKKMTPAP
jgi:general secretion pathway protein L